MMLRWLFDDLAYPNSGPKYAGVSKPPVTHARLKRAAKKRRLARARQVK